MSYRYCEKHETEATNGCRRCWEEQHGVMYQKNVDEGREGVICGVCDGEVDDGFVTAYGANKGDSLFIGFAEGTGIHQACAGRIATFVSHWDRLLEPEKKA